MGVFIDGFEIDVATQEEHNWDSTISSDPVEDGSPLSDNIRNLPAEITITGIVSDSPLADVESRRPVLDDSDSYTSLAYDRLLAIREARLPVTIETSLGTQQNMGLESLAMPRNAETGLALRFTARFKQLRLVKNKRLTVRVLIPRANSKRNRGAQQPTKAVAPDKDKTKKKMESTLSEWFR